MEAWSKSEPSLSVSLSRKLGRVGEGDGDSLRTVMVVEWDGKGAARNEKAGWVRWRMVSGGKET